MARPKFEKTPIQANETDRQVAQTVASRATKRKPFPLETVLSDRVYYASPSTLKAWVDLLTAEYTASQPGALRDSLLIPSLRHAVEFTSRNLTKGA